MCSSPVHDACYPATLPHTYPHSHRYTFHVRIFDLRPSYLCTIINYFIPFLLILAFVFRSVWIDHSSVAVLLSLNVFANVASVIFESIRALKKKSAI